MRHHHRRQVRQVGGSELMDRPDSGRETGSHQAGVAGGKKMGPIYGDRGKHIEERLRFRETRS